MTKDMGNTICVLVVAAILGGLFKDLGLEGLSLSAWAIVVACWIYLFLGYLDGKFLRNPHEKP